jgi:hypothetical protein
MKKYAVGIIKYGYKYRIILIFMNIEYEQIK